MKIQQVAVFLTVVNLLILMSNLFQVRAAKAEEDATILRGRGLEIVDDHGKLRAQVITYPASTTKEGEKYPETVLLRLIDPNGRPVVKMGGSVDGSGISLSGDNIRREWNGIQILAKGTGNSMILTNKDGRVQTIKP